MENELAMLIICNITVNIMNVHSEVTNKTLQYPVGLLSISKHGNGEKDYKTHLSHCC